MLRRLMLSLPPSGASVLYTYNAVNQSGSTISLSLPPSAIVGDLVLCVLRCRSDRSISIPSGWDLRVSTIVRSTLPVSDLYCRVYVISKSVSPGDSVYSFTHSASAAYGASLILVRGGMVISANYSDGKSISINKTATGSAIIVLALSNSAASIPSASAVPGYSHGGGTYFTALPSYFFVSSIYYRSFNATGTQSISATFDSPADQDGIVAIEVG